PEGAEVFRRRYAHEPDPSGQLVFGEYLLQLDDTTAVPWIRTLLGSPDTMLARRAWRLAETRWPNRFVDTLRSGPEMTQIQDLLLRFATGEQMWRTDGTVVEPFAPHDERPDQHLLIDDGLVEGIRHDPHWHDRFEIVSRDSVLRRSDKEGLVMA